MSAVNNHFNRSAGVLLPISSLPSAHGIGTMGREAFRFVDFLRRAGQRNWQVLPVGPTSFGDSPYQSFSAFAGNPYFIDLDILCEEGLLLTEEVNSVDWGGDPRRVDYEKLYRSRLDVLRRAFSRSRHGEKPEYADFCRENADWLEDYCLFMALKGRFGGMDWQRWDEDIRVREPEALARCRRELAGELDFWSFVQFKFFEQWRALRSYANSNGISIIGDIPIYIAMDSADAWANAEQFWMDKNKRPLKVAGVPPDYFSATGQLWGNPLYRWNVMRKDDFAWWRRRIAFSSSIYDVIRIDHFIGVVRYYAIDASAENAVNGSWQKGPGMRLIKAIDEARGSTRMIAEDLGEVSQEVRDVQQRSGYPGMKVLQFAFDGGTDNPFLPHKCSENFIVYTGTHDNNTTAGFIAAAPEHTLAFARDYLGVSDNAALQAAFIRAAMSGTAHTAIVPMQDWLGLGGEARINSPSTLGGNWAWRMDKDAATDELAARIARMTSLYGR